MCIGVKHWISHFFSWGTTVGSPDLCLSSQASKAGLRIYRPGMKMEEEESQGWLSWVWNWGGEPDTQEKEVKTGGKI